MIKISKEIINYTYLLKKIYCCNCFLDYIFYLIQKDFKDDEFFDSIEEKILQQKSNKNIFIKKNCVDDFVFCDNNDLIEICSACFLNLLRNSNVLTVISIDKKLLEK